MELCFCRLRIFIIQEWLQFRPCLSIQYVLDLPPNPFLGVGGGVRSFQGFQPFTWKNSGRNLSTTKTYKHEKTILWQEANFYAFSITWVKKLILCRCRLSSRREKSKTFIGRTNEVRVHPIFYATSRERIRKTESSKAHMC
jgi:hypothetical protein